MVDRPLLFISHKHENAAIASAIRDFVEMNTAGAVEVFQSSSQHAAAPRPGLNLNQELKAALWRASAFIMVYTHPELDWSYCMYEYGVANTPHSPDTRMILLRCSDSVPPLFAGQVIINARNRQDIEKFVDSFLTEREFFRGREAAITQHQPKSRAITTIAENLWTELQKHVPNDARNVDEWPAYPFIRLQLDIAAVDAIRKAPPADRLRVATDRIKREAVIIDYDKEASRVFNTPAFDKSGKFECLAQAWQEKDDQRDAQSRWVEALCRQIAEGARWKFPPLQWELMQGIDDDKWYAPMVARVRRMPDQSLEFDVYFFRFELDEAGQPVIGVPPAGALAEG